MQLPEPRFTPLERTVLEAICDKYPTDKAALEAQLSTATFKDRENTGAGFFTHFSVDRSSCPAIGGERLREGPVVQIDGVQHGMGFILWLEQGYADCIEGYVFGTDDTTAFSWETVRFEIERSGRSLT